MKGRSKRVAAASFAAILWTMPVAAEDATNWTGFFLGGHLGMLTSTTSFNDPNGPPIYGGSGVGNLGAIDTALIASRGHAQSLALTLPPLAVLMLEPEPAASPNAA